MTETVNITPPGGPIDILGQHTDSALLINKVPYQFNFLREVGSTLRYQIARSIDEYDLLTDKSFSDVLKYGSIQADGLSGTFEYILNLLAAGEYKLALTTIDHETELLEISESKGIHNQAEEYGGIVEVIATQSYLDEQVVQEYQNLIAKGNEPIVVMLTANTIEDNYILDGHHKFVAYKRVKQNARALQITKLNPVKIDNDMGLQLMDQCGQIRPEFVERFLN